MVIETAPGEEAQVDYATGLMVRDAQTGKYRRTRLFVLTLGYSRKAVRLLVFRSSSRVWAELHEKAFHRLGGVTRAVVLDNLREGVITPDIYEPALNPVYRDVLQHYGVMALPGRVQDPDRTAKSNPVSVMRRRRRSKDSASRALKTRKLIWIAGKSAGPRREFMEPPKRQVATVFAEERPALLPRPIEPFRYY